MRTNRQKAIAWWASLNLQQKVNAVCSFTSTPNGLRYSEINAGRLIDTFTGREIELIWRTPNC